MTPEQTIEAGIYARLTNATTGITTNAPGGYVSQSGGVQCWQGQIDLTPEGMVLWAGTSTTEGPKVLIVAGDAVDYEHEARRGQFVRGTYSVDIYIAASHGRDLHEAMTGDEAGDTGSPGIWQVKSDILDRLCNYRIVTGFPPALVKQGRTLARLGETILYQLSLSVVVDNLHSLTSYASLPSLDGVDITLIHEPNAGVGERLEVKTKVDLP